MDFPETPQAITVVHLGRPHLLFPLLLRSVQIAAQRGLEAGIISDGSRCKTWMIIPLFRIND